MKNFKFYIIGLVILGVSSLSCSKKEEPEPDFSKPHEKNVNDPDYYFNTDKGSINVTKYSGIISATLKGFDYPFNPSTYDKFYYVTQSSIKKIDENDVVRWEINIMRFEPNPRTTGGYNNVAITFTINQRSMPSSYDLELFGDPLNKTDSTMTISVDYEKWVSGNEVHNAKLIAPIPPNVSISPGKMKLHISGWNATTGLLSGNFTVLAKESSSKIDANVEGSFSVNLITVLQ